MKLFGINNTYLNLDNITKLLVVKSTYGVTRIEYSYAIYADDIKISKDFPKERMALQQLAEIVEYIGQGRERF